jgi:hypothetical protein
MLLKPTTNKHETLNDIIHQHARILCLNAAGLNAWIEMGGNSSRYHRPDVSVLLSTIRNGKLLTTKYITNMAEFIDGLRAFKPREGAPSFVIANLVVKKSELVNWLAQQDEEIRLDLKEAKNGSYYLQTNDYKKQ